MSEDGAHFDLIVGHWGEGAERGPEFMVIDSASRSVAQNELVGRALSRSEVIGTPLARQAFDLVDVIWSQERRIDEVRGAELD